MESTRCWHPTPHTVRCEALTPRRRGNAWPSARSLHGYLTPAHGTPTQVRFSESRIWDPYKWSTQTNCSLRSEVVVAFLCAISYDVVTTGGLISHDHRANQTTY